MNEDTDPLLFPDMPDEAAVAINDFLDGLYHHFQNHYCAQLHRHYHAIDERQYDNDPMRPTPIEDPPF
jgi:hypothetical protein